MTHRDRTNRATIGDRVELRDGRCGRLTDRDGTVWIVRIDNDRERPVDRHDFRLIGVDDPLPIMPSTTPGRGRPKALTADQASALSARYQAGEGVKALAYAFGLSDRTVRDYLIAAGCYVGRTTQTTPETRQYWRDAQQRLRARRTAERQDAIETR